MEMSQINTILTFMQRQDPNGFWLEWLEEIQNNESSFDPVYVINTLTEWYADSKDEKYNDMIDFVRSNT